VIAFKHAVEQSFLDLKALIIGVRKTHPKAHL